MAIRVRVRVKALHRWLCATGLQDAEVFQFKQSSLLRIQPGKGEWRTNTEDCLTNGVNVQKFKDRK